MSYSKCDSFDNDVQYYHVIAIVMIYDVGYLVASTSGQLHSSCPI